MKQAVIKDSTGEVVNIIEIEPKSSWMPPEGHSLIGTGENCDIGAKWFGGKFIRPEPESTELIGTAKILDDHEKRIIALEKK